MRKALLVLAISVVLSSAAIAQSMDVGQRQFQNRIFCGPTLVTSPVAVSVQRFSPNNNLDFLGYTNLNTYNCATTVLDREQEKTEAKPVKQKRRRL